MLRHSLALALLSLTPTAAAQSTVFGGAVTSARQAAAAGAASFTPTDDPAGFSLNPALLPGAADGVSGSGALIPVLYQDDAVATSATFARPVRIGGLSFRMGVGLGTTRADRRLDGADPRATNENRGRSAALAAGIETTGAARVAVGGTLRHTTERLSGFTVPADSRISTLSADLGALATLDLARLAGVADGPVSPVASLSAGYVQHTIGGDADRVFAQEQSFQTRVAPLNRQARLGWSATLGADLRVRETEIPALRLTAAVEAEGPLVGPALDDDGYVLLENGSSTLVTYPLLGLLSLRSALTGTGDILNSGAIVTQGRRAYTLEVAGVVGVVIGQTRAAFVADRGSPRLNRPLMSPTWGVGLDVGGALRTAGILSADASIQRLGERLRLRVDYAHDDFGGGYRAQSTNAVTLTAGWAL